MNEVGRHYLVLGVTQNPLEGTFGGFLHFGANGLVTCGSLGFDRQIDSGNSRCGYAESHPRKLALNLRQNETHGLGRTSGGRDNVDGGSTASLPILDRRRIHWLLRSSVSVHCRHQTFGDAVVLQDDLDNWGQAVGGAGRVRNNVVVGRQVCVIDPKNNGPHVAFGRSGNDNLLGSCLKVTGGQLLGHEQARGLDHDVDAQFAPRKSGGAFA